MFVNHFKDGVIAHCQSRWKISDQSPSSTDPGSLFILQERKSGALSFPFPTVKEQNSTKFEDLIGFIKRFMNWAASRIASREMLHEVRQDGRFFIARRVGKITSKRKVETVSARSYPEEELQRVVSCRLPHLLFQRDGGG